MNAKSNIDIRIGGVTPFTTIDFPGKLSAVVFCQGCPWQCQYCHNKSLQSVKVDAPYTWDDVCKWLQTRIGLLDGVVFSGGEPLLQKQLPKAAKQLHKMGFSVAVHTSGVYHERLKAVLKDVDWVGLDIKAPFDEYETITGAKGGENVRASLQTLLSKKTPFELRCTLDPDFFNVSRARKMAMQLAELGIKGIVLQTCRDTESRKPRYVPDEVIQTISLILPASVRRS